MLNRFNRRDHKTIGSPLLKRLNQNDSSSFQRKTWLYKLIGVAISVVALVSYIIFVSAT